MRRWTVRLIATIVILAIGGVALTLGCRQLLPGAAWPMVGLMSVAAIIGGTIRGLVVRRGYNSTDGLTTDQRRLVLTAVETRTPVSDPAIRAAAVRRLQWAATKSRENRTAMWAQLASGVITIVLSIATPATWLALTGICYLTLVLTLVMRNRRRSARLAELTGDPAPTARPHSRSRSHP